MGLPLLDRLRNQEEAEQRQRDAFKVTYLPKILEVPVSAGDLPSMLGPLYQKLVG